MDLSKAFDTLSHDLLTGKLDASGFGNHLLRRLFNYSVKRFHRIYQQVLFDSIVCFNISGNSLLKIAVV